MSVDAIVNIIVPLVAVIGGWGVGRQGLSTQTVEMLRVQVETLERSNGHKDSELTDLRVRVEVLEEMVTQRAAVQEVKEIVERIAAKVAA